MYEFFFFNDTATTEIYTLSLHDALPICFDNDIEEVGLILKVHGRCFVDARHPPDFQVRAVEGVDRGLQSAQPVADRKSTRLNSSHANISYAVFCLKKKKIQLRYHTHSHL